METVKKTENYTIFKKRNGRYSIKGAKGKWINGDDKTKILVAEGLIKVAVKSPAASAKSEETTEESAEA